MKNILLWLSVAFMFVLNEKNGFAQNISVNTSGAAADPSALLDVAAANKGFLIPRVTLTGTTDVATIAGTEATSLLVYNTASVSDVSPGFYYWDGGKWVKIITSGNGTSVNTNCFTCDGF